MNAAGEGTIRAGTVGLGMAGNGIVRSPGAMRGVALPAAAYLRENAPAAYREQYDGRIYKSFERLCSDPEVEAMFRPSAT